MMTRVPLTGMDSGVSIYGLQVTTEEDGMLEVRLPDGFWVERGVDWIPAFITLDLSTLDIPTTERA